MWPAIFSPAPSRDANSIAIATEVLLPSTLHQRHTPRPNPINTASEDTIITPVIADTRPTP
jgi:hypothetical protein